jgi:hypothetical protein
LITFFIIVAQAFTIVMLTIKLDDTSRKFDRASGQVIELGLTIERLHAKQRRTP